MRWDGGRFSRPIRWLVVKLDDAGRAAEVAGVATGGTRGHRLEARPGPDRHGRRAISTTSARPRVMVDAAERRAAIVAGLDAAGGWIDPMAEAGRGRLSRRVAVVLAGRVRRPLPGAARARRRHRHAVPPALLPGPLRAAALEPRFLFVANGGDPDVVRRGNEEVLVGRLDDARFAYAATSSAASARWRSELDRVSFLEGGRIARRQDGPARAARSRGCASGTGSAPTSAPPPLRAAALCKADLVSRLVGEFADLEGYAGSVYARAAGERRPSASRSTSTTARARPAGRCRRRTRAPCSPSPTRPTPLAVAFARGLEPTGSRDPYGLRRAAAGLVAIALDRGWRVDLPRAGRRRRPSAFVLDRLEPMLLEEGVSVEELRAARGSGATRAGRGGRAGRGPCTRSPGPTATPCATRTAAACASPARRRRAPVDEALLDGPGRARRWPPPSRPAPARPRGGGRRSSPAVERFFDDVLVMVRRRGGAREPAHAGRERGRAAAPPRRLRPASGIGLATMADRLEIHIVSDSTGDTAARVAQSGPEPVRGHRDRDDPPRPGAARASSWRGRSSRPPAGGRRSSTRSSIRRCARRSSRSPTPAASSCTTCSARR